MGFGEAVSTCFSKYARFSGRAPRSEYWWWFLFVLLVTVGVSFISTILGIGMGSKLVSPALNGLLDLFFLLPNISVAIRRLHDTNRSGWWYVAPFILTLFVAAIMIPVLIRMGENHEQGYDTMDGINSSVFLLAGVLGIIDGILGIVLFVWFCMRGTKGANRFGPDPLRDF